MTDHWHGAADQLARDLARVKGVVDAACAYADSTAEPTDTPHEDALLDAVAAYRAAPVRHSGIDTARDLARVREERDQLRREVERQKSESETRLAEIRHLRTEEVKLRAQLTEAQVAICTLVGVPRVGEPPRPGNGEQ